MDSADPTQGGRREWEIKMATNFLNNDGIVLENDTTVAQESLAFAFDARALALLRAADGDPANADAIERALENENAACVSSTAAQGSASAQAGAHLHAEGNTTSVVCQDFSEAILENAPMSFADIEAQIANAARKRIEDAERAIVDARARQERERHAREIALDAAQIRVADAHRAVETIDAQTATLRAQAEQFMRGDALAAMLAQIAAAADVARGNAEAACNNAEAERDEIIGEIKTARLADALELQLLEQDVERWQAAAPDVAEQMRRAADAEKLARRALDAAQRGEIKYATRALNDARTNGLAGDAAASLDGVIASAKNAKALRDLKARAERALTEADQVGAVGKIAQVERDAKAAGVAGDKWFARTIAAAYKAARAAKHARRAQAQPLARHLEGQGLIAVVGDGRIEAWHDASNGHHQWMLDRVLALRGGEWQTTTPRVPVVRKDDPRQGRRG